MKWKWKKKKKNSFLVLDFEDYLENDYLDLDEETIEEILNELSGLKKQNKEKK